MKKLIMSMVLALVLVLCATPVYAGIPTLPHAFYGEVEINGGPAPDGAQVSATVDVGSIVASQNPVTTEGGSYGIDSSLLLVQGDISTGAIITFHVTDANGTAIGGTATFEIGGGPTGQDLSVDIAEPEPTPTDGGGGISTKPKVSTDLFGEESHFHIDMDGEVQETVEATSGDGNLTITIPKDTIAPG